MGNGTIQSIVDRYLDNVVDYIKNKLPHRTISRINGIIHVDNLPLLITPPQINPTQSIYNLINGNEIMNEIKEIFKEN